MNNATQTQELAAGAIAYRLTATGNFRTTWVHDANGDKVVVHVWARNHDNTISRMGSVSVNSDLRPVLSMDDPTSLGARTVAHLASLVL